MSSSRLLLGVYVAIGCLAGFITSTLCIHDNPDEQNEHTHGDKTKALVILLVSAILQCVIFEVAIFNGIKTGIITLLYIILAICMAFVIQGLTREYRDRKAKSERTDHAKEHITLGAIVLICSIVIRMLS